MTRSQPRAALGTLKKIPAFVRIGVTVGILFSVILTAWLLTANRVPSLERFALIRNALAITGLFLTALIPIARFRNSAKELLPSSAIALGLGCLCYFAWTLYFESLADRMSATRVFILGMAVYGLASVLLWLGSLLRTARLHHLAMQPASRRRIP